MDIAPIRDRYLTDHQVAELIGSARSTLAKLRLRGGGPPFVKMGTSVRYPEAELRAWMEALPRRSSTSEP